MTFFRHRVTGTLLGGDVWISTMHSQSFLGIDDVHTAWHDMMNTFIGGTLKAMWNTHQDVTEVLTDALDPLTGKNTAQRESDLAITGTGTGGSVDPSTSAVVSMFTGVPTRSGRGRMYFPSPDGSHFTTAGLYVQADCQTLANAFLAAATTFGSTSTPVIYHRLFHNADVITQYKVADVPGNQRRRKNKMPKVYSIGA